MFKEQKQTKSKRDMADGSRLVLCYYPFNSILARIHS